MKRVERRADRLGGGDGRARRRLQRDAGARARARNLRDLGVNVDLAPVLDVARPGGAIAETERGFGSTAARVAATAIPFATGLQDGGVAATAQALPGPRRGARKHRLRGRSGSASRRRELRAVDEAPYRAFVAAGRRLVMLSTAIYPAFSPRPGRLHPPHRDRRAARPPRLRRRLDHRRARNGRGRAFGGARRSPSPPPAPAPTCSSSPPRPPSGHGGRWSRGSRPRARPRRVRGRGPAGARPARELGC